MKQIEEKELLVNSDDEDHIDYPEGWKRKRKRTMGIFFFSFYIMGLEFTTIYSTLWQYVKKDMSNADPYLAYGMIASGRFVVPLLFLVEVSRWFDRTRSLRRFMIVTGLMTNVGYALYMVHTFTFLPMLGTILQGKDKSVFLIHNKHGIRTLELFLI